MDEELKLKKGFLLKATTLLFVLLSVASVALIILGLKDFRSEEQKAAEEKKAFLQSNAYTDSLEALETIPNFYSLFEQQKPTEIKYLNYKNIVLITYPSGKVTYSVNNSYLSRVTLGDAVFTSNRLQMLNSSALNGKTIVVTFTQEQINWIWEDYRYGTN